MTSDQFTKLFVHMEKRFTSIESALEQKADRTQIDRIFVTLDAIVKHVETDSQERAAMIAQLDRFEARLDGFGSRLSNVETKLDAVL